MEEGQWIYWTQDVKNGTASREDGLMDDMKRILGQGEMEADDMLW